MFPPHRPNPLFFALQQILHEKVGCTAKASFACNGSIWAPNDKWVERGGKREREKERERKCVKWPEALPDVSPVTETDCSGRDTSHFWVWVTLKADDSMISIKEAVRDEEMSGETQSQRSQCNTRHTEKTKCLFLFFLDPCECGSSDSSFCLDIDVKLCVLYWSGSCCYHSSVLFKRRCHCFWTLFFLLFFVKTV